MTQPQTIDEMKLVQRYQQNLLTAKSWGTDIYNKDLYEEMRKRALQKEYAECFILGGVCFIAGFLLAVSKLAVLAIK